MQDGWINIFEITLEREIPILIQLNTCEYTSLVIFFLIKF